MSQLKLCAHTKTDGTPCQAIPVHDSPYCYFHRSYYKAPALPGQRNYRVPLLESHQAVQLAVTDLYQSFLSGTIGFKEAKFALQILRLASKTITEIERNAKAADRERAGVVACAMPSSPVPEAKNAAVAPDLKPQAPKATPNPFVNAKPAYKGERYVDPYGCLAPMIAKEKEKAAAAK